MAKSSAATGKKGPARPRAAGVGKTVKALAGAGLQVTDRTSQRPPKITLDSVTFPRGMTREAAGLKVGTVKAFVSSRYAGQAGVGDTERSRTAYENALKDLMKARHLQKLIVSETIDLGDQVDHQGEIVLRAIFAGAEDDDAGVREPVGSAYEPSPRARALLRGLDQREQDLRAAGGAYELDEVRSLLNDITPQAVTKRVRNGSLLAVPGPEGRRRYPTSQFLSDGRPLPRLKEVVRAFPSDSPWMLLNFLVNPDPKLGGRKPIDLLQADDVEPVLESARRVGLQGG